MTVVHKTNIIIILALVIAVSYTCRSNIDVTYVSYNSWLTTNIFGVNTKTVQACLVFSSGKVFCRFLFMTVSGDVGSLSVMDTVTVAALIAASRSHLSDQYLIYFSQYGYFSAPFANLYPSYVKNYTVE